MTTNKTKFPMVDSQSGATSRSFHFSGTAAQHQSASEALLAALKSASGVGVTKTVNTTQTILSGAANQTAAELASNKDEGFTLFVTRDDGLADTLQFPCPKKDVATGLYTFITNGVVDITNPVVVALVAQFAVNGYGGNTADSLHTLANGKRVVSVQRGRLDP